MEVKLELRTETFIKIELEINEAKLMCDALYNIIDTLPRQSANHNPKYEAQMNLARKLRDLITSRVK